MNDVNQPLGQEWITLQNNHEHYERGALALKVTTVVFAFALLAVNLPALIVALVVLALWLQEGIYRTSQSRLGQRLQVLEGLIRSKEPGTPFQLHTQWQAARPGVGGLLREYVRNALRPTVAYPYVVLLLGLLALYWVR
jgi:hypothetical protein